MADRRTPLSGGAQGGGPASPPGEMEPINERNIGQAEKETMEKANRAITILEKALAEWEGSKEKPEDIRGEFLRFRGFHDALALWETKMLRTAGAELDFFTRVDRLWDFVKICRMYS